MAKKKKRKPQKRQSLGTSILLFCLSICMLVGASVLFSFVSQHKDLPFSAPDFGITANQDAADQGAKKEAASQKSSLGDYAFYDLLSKRDSEIGTEELHYTIQLAAFKSSDRATDYCRRLQKKHRLKCRQVRQGSWILVRWGSFPTRAAAERYQKKISGIIDHECMIVKM